jgi:hypothetical protein
MRQQTNGINVAQFYSCQTESACAQAPPGGSTPSDFEAWNYTSLPPGPDNSTLEFKLLRIHVVDLGIDTDSSANRMAVGLDTIESVLAASSLWYRHRLGITFELSRFTTYADILSGNQFSIINSTNGTSKTGHNFNGAICEDDPGNSQTTLFESFEGELIRHYNLSQVDLMTDVDLVLFVSGDELVFDANQIPLLGCATPTLISEDGINQSLNHRQVWGRFSYAQLLRPAPATHWSAWSLSYPLFESAVTVSHEIGHSLGGSGHPFDSTGFPSGNIATKIHTVGFCYSAINCLPRDIMENDNPIAAFNPVYFFPTWVTRITDGPTSNNEFRVGTSWLNHTRLEMNPLISSLDWMPGGYRIENWWLDVKEGGISGASLDQLTMIQLSIRGYNAQNHHPEHNVSVNTLSSNQDLASVFPLIWLRNSPSTCAWNLTTCSEVWHLTQTWIDRIDSVDTSGCQSETNSVSYCLGTFVIQFRKVNDTVAQQHVEGVSRAGDLTLNNWILSPDPSLTFIISGHNGTYADGTLMLPDGTPPNWVVLSL